MELGTFGAVMKFALQLESDSIEMYDKVIPMLSESREDAKLITKLKDASVNRIRNLERVRRENVTEMILEPIRDFDSSQYELTRDNLSEGKELPSMLKRIEQCKRAFYSEASIKIEFLIEASTVFEQFADDCESNIEAIHKLL